jgi:hypothetical protein
VLGRQDRYAPAVGRDRLGRYWLVWYGQGGGPSGLFVLQFDPGTLKPIGRPARAPGSGSAFNNNVRLTFACAATCRVMYLQTDDRIVSWAYGERKATLVATVKGGASHLLAAAYTPSGRLWVAWWDARRHALAAVLGGASGAGGKVVALGRPPRATDGFGYMAAATSGTSLVLVENWSVPGGYDRYVNVVPAP